MPKKFTIIGAGSKFSFGIAADLIREPAFADSTLALVDPSEQALDTSTRIVKRMVETAGSSLTIESSSNRRDVIADSDYVLNSIAVVIVSVVASGAVGIWSASQFAFSRRWVVYAPMSCIAI